MDLAPPGRAAAAATQGGGARAPLTIRFLVAFGEFRPVDHDRCPFARATRAPRRRPLSPVPFCAWGSGWSRGWTSGCWGERPRRLRGRRSIAGLLRTAAGGLRRALHPSTGCSGSGTRRFSFSRMATGAGGDGARGWTSRRKESATAVAVAAAAASGASGRGGHLRGRGSSPVDHPFPLANSGPVDHDRYRFARASRCGGEAATAVADSFLRLANSGSGWSRGWTSRRRGERPRPTGSPRDRRAVAHRG
jgi:hypothetical protein